jgi:hypothetical protein
VAQVARTGTSPATYPSWAGRFYSVSATSPDDVWAVGPSAAGGQIAHWDGTSWSDTDFSDGYQAVDALSPTDVWAVGGTSWFYPTQTLARWTRLFFRLPTHTAQFLGVAAISRKDAWAVGGTGTAPNSALIEHWNGYRWRRVTTRPGLGYLQGVTATKWNNVWAAGYNNSGPRTVSLILHFNGTSWSRVRSPNPTGSTNWGSTIIEHWNGAAWNT